MFTLPRSSKRGTSALLAIIAALGTGALSSAYAETVATVNGVDIDSAVVDLYLTNRTQQPAADSVKPLSRN